jgi:hypothetical protein
LDTWGEEDVDLRRGKPLYLSDERYAHIHTLWRNNTLLHACMQRWLMHPNHNPW